MNCQIFGHPGQRQPTHRTGEEACGPNTNCVNLEWGYDCECAQGYEQDMQVQGLVKQDLVT